MRETTKHDTTQDTIAVDIYGLMELLSCGKPTAKEIGEKSESRIPTSGRRVLYSVEKIKNYISTHSY